MLSKIHAHTHTCIHSHSLAGWFYPSSSRCKEVRGQLQRDRGRTLSTMCTCEEIKRGTHACKASKLGPVERWWTQDGKLRITIQDPAPSPEDGHIYGILLIRILSRVWKLAPLLLVLRYYEHLFLFSMLILHVTSSRFCLCLLNNYLLSYTFSHTHTEAHTHKHTCTISTQQEWRQPGTGAWVREAEERLLETLHKPKKKLSGNPDIHKSQQKIQAHRASSKAISLFLTK